MAEEKYKKYLQAMKRLAPTWPLMLRQIRLDESIRDTLPILGESVMKTFYEQTKK